MVSSLNLEQDLAILSFPDDEESDEEAVKKTNKCVLVWEVGDSSFFLIFIFYRQRKGERKGERNIDWLPLTHAPMGDQTHNPGMCPDQELNCDPTR